MDHHAYRAAVHRQLSGYFVRRPDMVDEQVPIVRRLLARHPVDNASGINIEVRAPL